MEKFYMKYNYDGHIFHSLIVSNKNIVLQYFIDSTGEISLFKNDDGVIIEECSIPNKLGYTEQQIIDKMLEEIDDIERISNSEKLESSSDFYKMVTYEIQEPIDDEGDDIFKGFQIMKKYLDNVCTYACHEMIFGTDINEVIEKGITIQDCKHLVHLRWLKDDESDSFVHFV